jgi:hypothetical protein
MTDSITLYGKSYANLPAKTPDKALPEGANGFYRKEAGGILFFTTQKEPRAYIRKDGLGPVSLAHPDGVRHYMYSTSSLDEKWLCVPESYMQTVDGARDIAKQLFKAS